MSLGSTTSTRGRGHVVPGYDSQIADLVPEGVPVNSHGLRRSGQISLVGAKHGDDVLLLEFTLRLIESHPSTNQLIDNLKETSVEVLLRHHTSPVPSEEGSGYHSTGLDQDVFEAVSRADLDAPQSALG